MKKVCLSTLVFLLPVLLIAQAQQVNFSQESWNKLKAKAAKENKLIFLDAYTTWCGPCKQMDKNVFPKAEVASFFNSNFINAKIDMEKGEGPDLARTYGIAAFPSLLFVNAEGKMVHRGVGFHNEDQILELANVALKGTNSLASMEKQYADGDRDPKFLLQYTMIRAELMNNSHLPVAETYLAGQDDWTAPNHLDFIYSLASDTDTKLFDYLLEKKSLFADRFGSEAVEQKINGLIMQEADPETGEEGFAKLDALFARVYPDRAKSLSANYRMSYYRQQGDRENFSKVAVDYMKSNKTASADELNEMAWTFFQISEDKALLKQASKWAKKAIKKDPQVYIYDTLASLYEKMGLGKKAMKVAAKGIALARETGDDDSALQELVERLIVAR